MDVSSPVVTAVSCSDVALLESCAFETASSCANNPYEVIQLYCWNGEFAYLLQICSS